MAENLIKEISIRVGNHTFNFMFEALKTDFVLFGRSTFTVEATNLSDGKKYLLKFSWQESCRPREAVVIQKAREIGAKEGVLENLPQLIAHAELEPDLASTAKLTEQLGFDKVADEVKGSRTLFILAFDILEPITSLQGKALWKAYWEIIKCHYILWKGGIQHGDISVSNLMHRNGTGVLNDFDLARLTTPGNVDPRGFDGTGTKPFLALDLLTADARAGKVERRYRHDLESFLWVLTWITACYDSGVESIPARHGRWLNEDVETCLAEKSRMLGDTDATLESITTSYEPLTAVTMVLHEYWADLHAKRVKQRFSSRFDYALAKSAGASSSKSTPVIMEPTDEEVLLNMLRAFTSQPIVEFLRPSGLLDDLPLTLFPEISSGPSTKTFCDISLQNI